MIGNINPSAGVNTERYYRKISLSHRSSHLFLSPCFVHRIFIVLHSFSDADDATPNRRYIRTLLTFAKCLIFLFFPCSLSSQIFHRIKMRYLSKTRRLSWMNYFAQEQSMELSIILTESFITVYVVKGILMSCFLDLSTGFLHWDSRQLRFKIYVYII